MYYSYCNNRQVIEFNKHKSTVKKMRMENRESAVHNSCTEIFKIFSGKYRERTPYFSQVLGQANSTTNFPLEFPKIFGADIFKNTSKRPLFSTYCSYPEWADAHIKTRFYFSQKSQSPFTCSKVTLEKVTTEKCEKFVQS